MAAKLWQKFFFCYGFTTLNPNGNIAVLKLNSLNKLLIYRCGKKNCRKKFSISKKEEFSLKLEQNVFLIYRLLINENTYF